MKLKIKQTKTGKTISCICVYMIINVHRFLCSLKYAIKCVERVSIWGANFT